MRVLAEAMSMHCRTRSADEILAYMQDEAASASKRPNNGVDNIHILHQTTCTSQPAEAVAAAVVVVEAYDHSHSAPTVCNDDVPMNAVSHSHDHSTGLAGF